MSKSRYQYDREAHKNEQHVLQALNLIEALAQDQGVIVRSEREKQREAMSRSRKRAAEDERRAMDDANEEWHAQEDRCRRQRDLWFERDENARRSERNRQVKLMDALIKFVGVRLD